MTRIEELVALHKSVGAAREAKNGSWNKTLATIEDEILQLIPVEGTRTAQQWSVLLQKLANLLHTTVGTVKNRRQLLTYGDVAEPFWAQLDVGLPPATAIRQLRQPKKVKSPRRVDPLAGPLQDEGAKAFWMRVRGAVRAFVAQRLPNATADELDIEMDSFEKDLLALCELHRSKWEMKARQERQTRLVSRTRFCNALRVLHMDPPKRGSSLAATLAQANRQKRTLARLYHPDTNEGSDTTRPQFQAVIDAYLLVEQYVNENTPNSPPQLRVVEGGKTR